MQPENNGLRPLQITEDDLQASAPSVRALLVARLEQLWAPVALRLAQEAEGIPVDPRMLEIGLRVVTTEANLYRLGKAPASVAEDEVDELGAGVDRRALVEERLKELEERAAKAAQPPAA